MKKKQSGFTLVEAIVAVAIFSLVLMLVYGTFTSVLRVTKAGSDATKQVQRERIALKTIVDALSGIVYYEQNQERYAFEADTADPDYPALSFVSRLPPDFLGSKEFGPQRLRRIDFIVEDVEVELEVDGMKSLSNERSLVMYQTPILQPVEDINLTDRRGWVLGPRLDSFDVYFWSTIQNDWIPEWIETNSVPARLKFEMSFRGKDGSPAEIVDIHKREIMIFSDSITQAQQNPPLPGKAGGSGGRGKSARGRLTAAQSADWSRRRESSRSSGQSMFTSAQRDAFRKQMAERFAKRQRDQGGRPSIPGAGQGAFPAIPIGGNPVGGGDPAPGAPGGAGGIPGQSTINNALIEYFNTTGQTASNVNDLVAANLFDSQNPLPAPPPGTQWVINPDGASVGIQPL